MRRVLKWIPIESLIFGLMLAGILFVPQQIVPFGLWAVLAGLAFLARAGFHYYQKRSLFQLESGVLMSATLCLVAGMILLVDPTRFWPAILAGLVVSMAIGLILEISKQR